MKTNFTRFTIIFSLLLISVSSFAILTPQVDSIPMRDGRKLAADVYIPSRITSGPVILIQTPYDRLTYRTGGLPLGIGANLDSSNYIFVIVDWRGFYGSAAAAYSGSPNHGQDGYDCVEWIAQQLWSNTKIGTWGPSALGDVQFMTAENNPPHLTCICPLVSGPQTTYNDYFPTGDLRTEYIEQLDGLGFGIATTIMPHPFFDGTWTVVQNVTFYPDSILVPCYMIGGWYGMNIEKMMPFFEALQTQSPANVQHEHRLLMGPWAHGGHGSAKVGTPNQGELVFNNAAYWSDSLAVLFFDYHLRGVANNWDQSPYVQYYQVGDDVWLNSPSWPPAGPVDTNFYFHANGLMDILADTSARDSISFMYDPENPSPTIGGPTLLLTLLQGPYDQAPQVESRNDILIFTTDTLKQSVAIKGNAVIHLKVSGNRFDTDFDVRLTDVYSDTSMLVNTEAMRMRFRNGETTADTAMMVPGTVYDCSITLPTTCHTFVAGHRIRVDVTSSNYPEFNRNANTDGIMYPGLSLDSLQNPLVATNTVYTNSINASYITLPVVNFAYVTTAVENLLPTNPALKLYPNPVTNLLTVETNSNMPQQTVVLNTLGQKLFETTITQKGVVDFSGFAQGVYLVGVKDGVGNEVYGKVVR